MPLSRLSFAGLLPVLFAIGCGSVSPAADASGTAGSSAGGSSTGSTGTAGQGGAGSIGAGGAGGSVGGSGGKGGSSGGGGSAGGSGNTGTGGSGVCTCTLQYAPVCGVNGKTYGNACEASCASVTVAHQGPCADGGSDGPTSSDACVTDNDCIFRAAAGCCGVCLAKSDPVPPSLPCGAACRIGPPSCVCENHRCAIGTLPTGATCDPTHNLCGYAICCPQCGGFRADGGVSCSAPVCTQPASGSSTCPPGP